MPFAARLVGTTRLSDACADPHPSAEDSEAMAVMASLREKVSEKTAEIDNLHQKMSTLAKEHETDVSRACRRPCA